MDMKNEVNTYISNNMPLTKFNSYSVNPAAYRRIRSYVHILFAFPKTFTYKLRADLGETDLLKILPTAQGKGRPAGNIVQHLNVKQLSNLSFKFGHLLFAFLTPEEDAEYSKRAYKAQDPFDYKKVMFGTWLGCVAIQGKTITEDGVLTSYELSREVLIRRMANILGGSHPEGALETGNGNDLVVRYLMESSLIGLPLPYMLLMKISYDILEAFSFL